ncbi:AIPR family protein [Microbulbifer sp. S227A]|uniref:AIPR family protein n=1 Tax=Microbulbifer sp. S227A TaxID=3415131 RepID=UPI003C7E9A2C
MTAVETARVTQMDWDIVGARVSDAVSRHSFPTNSIGFLSVVLEQLFPSIQDQLQEAITDGSDDRGIDAVHIVENETSAEVFLFQSKYREHQKSCSKTINDSEVLKVSLFLNELFEKADSLANCNNFRLNEAVNRIWQLHEDGKICRYRVIFCSNGQSFSESASKIAASVTSSHPQVSFEFYGVNDVMRGFASEGRAVEDGCLQVVGKEILERSDGDIRGVVASVDAKSFIDLIRSEDGAGIKRHLFDDNLRVYLGAKGGYNSSIIKTANSKDSYLFWYLNNGVTITCRNFSYNKGHTNPTLRFEDFQIVNGAQTSHSLLEASRDESENLDNVVVMVRVYATDREGIAERVAVATNSQARIQSRDLRSNHQSMKKLELAFREHGYFFERKKNMHSDKPDSKRIDALKLGQILLAFELRDPDKAKSESDSIFDTRFNHIFHERRDIKQLINLFELYRHIEDLRDRYISEHGTSPENGHEHQHQYLVYGHWFVLYACKLLLVKDQKQAIPCGDEKKELVEEAIRRVANACSQHKAVAHYQMFRSPRTKDKILGEISAAQIDFFDLLSVS